MRNATEVVGGGCWPKVVLDKDKASSLSPFQPMI